MILDPICAFLKDERKKQGLSLEEVGHRMGRTQGRSTIWQWEKGVNMPSLKNAREWALALGYGIDLRLEEPRSNTNHQQPQGDSNV